MIGHPGRSTLWSNVPAGLLGMLCLVGAVERWVSHHSYDFTHPELWDWKAASAAAQKIAPKCEILCLGDSLLKVGFLPKVLEHHTGKSSHNMAVFAGQAPGSYFLLRRALESGARPKAVVVDFKPTILNLPPAGFVDRWSG